MRQFLVRHISWIVFTITLALLTSHILGWQRIRVDVTTLILVTLLLFSPFVQQFRRIRVGDVEAEIAPIEVTRIKSQVDKQLSEGRALEEAGPEVKPISDSLVDLLDRDHILALAKLRMELERVVNRLLRAVVHTGEEKRPMGLRSALKYLVDSGHVSRELSEPIQAVISWCNRAIHGDYVRESVAQQIIDVGISVLDVLHSALAELIVEPVETNAISQAEVDSFSIAKYRVTTITPLVENPVRNVRILDQEGLDFLLEGYNEYAEFLTAMERINTEGEDLKQNNASLK